MLALVGPAGMAGPAVGSPTIVVSGDSVLATSLPTLGQATIKATRPDALSGAPVTIGIFSGFANPLGPFSANTTTPSAVSPNGDCWQKGLTPDLQPGDTITVTQSEFLGGFWFGPGGGSHTVVAPANLAYKLPGPIQGCASVAPWARNAVTNAPATVAGGSSLTVSGVAQPRTADVAVAATDRTHTTSPVDVAPASDGSWTATIPAGQLRPLANSDLTVRPVMAVPDLATGAQAHIAGVSTTVHKTTAAPRHRSSSHMHTKVRKPVRRPTKPTRRASHGRTH